MTESVFPTWGKTERISKLYMTITEKIDGTNALVEVIKPEDVYIDGAPCAHRFPSHVLAVHEGLYLRAGSRSRWLKPGKNGVVDNFGFAGWVSENCAQLIKLGVGRHYGEWWGQGIQRRYGLDNKRFSLFNTHQPIESLPACVHQVPVLYTGAVDLAQISQCMDLLRAQGSEAAPGFMNPEGIVIWLNGQRYKQTFEAGPKGRQEAA